MALMYEELGDGGNPWSVQSSTPAAPRRSQAQQAPPPLPAPPPRWISKTVEEKKNSEAARSLADDKWSNLKAYRWAKGLCFFCSEKWGRDHQCKASIQLHIVQEMIDCMHTSVGESDSETTMESATSQQLMLLSTAAVTPGHTGARSMQISVEIQGKLLRFLIDSGSSACFLDQQCAEQIEGKQQLAAIVQVVVAGGNSLHCTYHFPNLSWSSQGHTFCDDFRVLALHNYDGIIGLDWLAKHSPMITHWAQQWLAFPMGNEMVVLHGDGTPGVTHALVELHLVQPPATEKGSEHCPRILQLLEEFSSVFTEPSGLPPARQYEHHIPLIPGARPVSMRPYRVAPELKIEIER